MSDQTGLRVAVAWLAGASLLLAVALSFHGPLHPDLDLGRETRRPVDRR